MVSSAESPVHENWKRAIVEAKETDTVFLNRRIGPGLRALRTRTAEALEHSDENALAQLSRAQELYFGGDMEASIALTGQVAGRIEGVLPVAAILEQIVKGFFEVIEQLDRRYPRSEQTLRR